MLISTSIDDISLQPATVEEQANCPPLASGLSGRRRRSLPQTVLVDACSSRANYHSCPIKAGSTNKICVDTSSEIEYCGRECRNCLDIEGAENVGCTDSQCTVSSCREGYTLTHGQCL